MKFITNKKTIRTQIIQLKRHDKNPTKEKRTTPASPSGRAAMTSYGTNPTV